MPHDLLDLKMRGVLLLKKRGRKMVFTVPSDLAGLLRKMAKDARIT